MDKSSKRKGALGERELARLLEEEGYPMERGGACFGTVPDLVGLPGIHVEFKRVEKLNVSEAMRQAERDADRFLEDKMPRERPAPDIRESSRNLHFARRKFSHDLKAVKALILKGLSAPHLQKFMLAHEPPSKITPKSAFCPTHDSARDEDPQPLAFQGESPPPPSKI